MNPLSPSRASPLAGKDINEVTSFIQRAIKGRGEGRNRYADTCISGGMFFPRVGRVEGDAELHGYKEQNGVSSRDVVLSERLRPK